MSGAEWIGSIGVSLLLLAFFLNLTGRLARDGRPYAAFNAVGGALACASAWMIGFVPFVVLEGTWAVVALFALLRHGRRPARDARRPRRSARATR